MAADLQTIRNVLESDPSGARTTIRKRTCRSENKEDPLPQRAETPTVAARDLQSLHSTI